VSGVHYQRTSLDWLANLDAHEAELQRLVGKVQVRRWRAFFAGCAALFGHDDGEAFGVSHYLFRARHQANSATPRRPHPG
jgi:cyclopropane-fatty-acyl-phospholipid synthase